MSVVQTQSQSSQIGAIQFGSGQFLQSYNITTENTVSTRRQGRLRSQLGWGFYSELQWTKGYKYRIRERRQVGGASANITITSVSGALVGQIRTDIQKSIVQSIEFTVDENGSADFVMKLNRLPDFEILPMSIITINIGDSDFDWYKGVVTYPDTEGAYRDSYEFRGFGLRRWLENLRADTDFGVGMDIRDIMQVLAEDWIAPFSPIRYNPAKIAPSTGVILGTTIELGKFSLRQVLDTLSTMANAGGFFHVWGVDGDGEFYFERKAINSMERTFFIGYNLHDFQPKLNYEEVKNVITMQRQEGRAAGGAGWSVAGVYNDESSVAKYGRNELNYQIPGFFADNEADIIGNALIEDLAEPKNSAKTSGWQARTQLDFLPPGNYRFIMPLGDFSQVASDLDDATEFTVFGAGDLTVNDDTQFMLYGSKGIRFDFQNAENQRAEIDIEAFGFIQEVRFYVRGSVAGAYLTAGVGEGAWNEQTIKVEIPQAEVFYPIRWDLRESNIRDLKKFAIRIDENAPAQRKVWIDKLEVLLRGHRTYTMRLKRAVYRYSPDGSGADCEFGSLPSRLTDYIAGLQATASELKFTGEIR